MVQASSSFEHLDTFMFMYTTPTLITEAPHLVIQVQLLLTSESTPYIVLPNLYLVTFYDEYQCQGQVH